MRPQDCSRTETSHEFRETVKPQLALNSGEAHLAAAENAQGKLATHALHNGICEAHVRRKLDRHMMPLLFVLYMLAFLDRSNIGNARTAGMQEALHLHGEQYDWLLTIFYITYVVFDFTILCWKRFPPHICGAVVVFFWGLLAMVQAGAHSWSGMMAIRFSLGAFEAAYAPGIIYLFSFFYLRHEVGYRCGLFASAAPLASTFAGALAYGITSGHPKLASWRLLFLVEGLPTVLLAPFAFFFIPDSPDQARFLNADEKAIAKSRGVRQAGTLPRIGGLKLNEVAQTLFDVKAWLTALMYFSANVSFASLPVFLPTILTDMGYSKINAQGLSAPPYFLSFLLSFTTTWIADKTQQRAFVTMITSAVGGAGYVILATVDTVGVRYFAVFIAAAGVFPTISNILPWVLNNQGTDTRRGAGLVLINIIGQCGPILGTRLYPTTEAPRYVKGMSVCAAFMFFTTLLAAALRLLLSWENQRLDNIYGTPADQKEKEKETSDDDTDGEENYGPRFRFVL